MGKLYVDIHHNTRTYNVHLQVGPYTFVETHGFLNMKEAEARMEEIKRTLEEEKRTPNPTPAHAEQ